MLTLLRRSGYRFFVKSGSATEKPHIYVTRDGDTSAKFLLEPVSCVANIGLERNELRRVEMMVSDMEPQLLQVWQEYVTSSGVKLEEEKKAHKQKLQPEKPEQSAIPVLEKPA